MDTKKYIRKFYRCNTCTNLLVALSEGGTSLECCGTPMELLTSNRDDRDDDEQNVLLHWPLITKDAESREIRVKVSTLRHPMDPVHYIQWMLCIQGNHSEFRRFKPGENCDTTFALLDPRENAAVYVYCNHHGLWAAITGIEKMPRALAGG